MENEDGYFLGLKIGTDLVVLAPSSFTKPCSPSKAGESKPGIPDLKLHHLCYNLPFAHPTPACSLSPSPHIKCPPLVCSYTLLFNSDIQKQHLRCICMAKCNHQMAAEGQKHKLHIARGPLKMMQVVRVFFLNCVLYKEFRLFLPVGFSMDNQKTCSSMGSSRN